MASTARSKNIMEEKDLKEMLEKVLLEAQKQRPYIEVEKDSKELSGLLGFKRREKRADITPSSVMIPVKIKIGRKTSRVYYAYPGEYEPRIDDLIDALIDEGINVDLWGGESEYSKRDRRG
jgi:hypothetical protein